MTVHNLPVSSPSSSSFSSPPPPPNTMDIRESGDELDCLTPSSRTAASRSAATTPTLQGSEEPGGGDETPTSARKLRLRPPKPEPSTTPTKIKLAVPNKKRTLLDFAGFEATSNVQNLAKKPKTELKKPSERKNDKKANTIVIHRKKIAIEASRRRWLHRHRDLFAPLLPPTTRFFDTIDREILESVDKGTYIPYRELTEQPRLIQNGELKDYQLRGLSFLAHMHDNGMNCILGDEMGLGKTLQTLSLFAYVKESSKSSVDPHLIVCPLSVVDTWIRELNHWMPSFRVLRFHAQESERTRLKNAVRDGQLEFDVCVTTYEGFVAEDTWFKSKKWTYAVLDEGHRIKNRDTQIARSVQGIGSLYRLILTGTPVQNNLVELWGLLHWLYPTVFTDSTEKMFHEAFNLTQGTYALPFLTATEKLLSKVMLRRTKDTVEGQISIPPKEELTVFIPMSQAQRFWTYRLLTKLDSLDLEGIFASDIETEEKENLAEDREEVKRYLEEQPKENQKVGGEGNSQWKRLMNLLMQLRKVCNHPYLLPDVEPDPYTIGPHVVSSSSKLILIDKLLKDILPSGERVLIFSQWTGMLDLLEDFMALRSVPYARLDGSTPRARRTLDIKLFQQEKSPYQVYSISTKAGGLGINLTKATHVIMFDSDWNPQNDLQAIARAHRIGQTKPVKVYRLICQGSVEDQMLDRIRRKLFLSMKVMNNNTASPDTGTSEGSDSVEEQNSSLKRTELMSILRKGSSAISGIDSVMTLSQFLSAPIETILEASRVHDDVRTTKMKKDVGGEVKDEEGGKMLFDAEEEEKKLLQGVAQVQSRLFEGKLVERAKEKKKSDKEVAEEWRQEQKRQRKSRYVTVEGYEVLAEYLDSETPAGPPPKKEKRKGFDSEDWCMHCRDGGELILCSSCPRVVHASCEGLSKTAVKKMMSFTCSHHRCADCGRKTADAGGMLFRCRTCPQAYCEDCLPQGDIHAIGDTLPEMLVLGYGEKTGAYYIQCYGCLERFETEPMYKKQWEGEFREAEEKLAAMQI
ncbi:SNF2 family N-terminal domain-containing protein [Irpex rosettiformis]|uniref:SNF2 family N-terminal domain-containing protein n=1 Tax=Irpex rosettiformis TaxID=378272 RepID=A0ACB8TXU0_9APHY|nr:SNF2 family N-terminal domain-containing protein [Irpex rosettiformis]